MIEQQLDTSVLLCLTDKTFCTPFYAGTIQLWDGTIFFDQNFQRGTIFFEKNWSAGTKIFFENFGPRTIFTGTNIPVTVP